MKVTVVTPYYRESEAYLRRAHDSVSAQTHPCRHIMVADGYPNRVVDGWAVEHLGLVKPSSNDGNMPRAVGAERAIAAGAEAILFLDADNWFRPDHVESLVQLHRASGAAICTSGRSINAIDESLLIALDSHVDGEHFVDANCLFIARSAFHLLPYWRQLPKPLTPLNDVLFWMTVAAAEVSTAHTGLASVGYRTGYPHHYLNLGLPVPQGAALEREARINRGKMYWCGMRPAEKLAVLLRDGGSFPVNDRVRRIEETQFRDPLFQLGAEILVKSTGEVGAELGKAEALFRAVATSFPGHAGAASNLAFVLDRADRAAEALDHALRAVALEPDLAMLWSNAGNILARLGRLDEAERHFRRALELAPEAERYKMKIATLAERRGRA